MAVAVAVLYGGGCGSFADSGSNRGGGFCLLHSVTNLKIQASMRSA